MNYCNKYAVIIITTKSFLNQQILKIFYIKSPKDSLIKGSKERLNQEPKRGALIKGPKNGRL